MLLNPSPDHSGRRSQGQVLVVFAIFLIVLIGASAITIDYATWLKVRRDYQNMADAAALQGAALLTRPMDNAKRILAREAAWESLQDQLGLGPSIDPSVLRSSDTPSGAPVVDPATGYRMWVSTPPIGLSSETIAKYPGASTGADDRTIFVWVERTVTRS
jgi:Flp pilus assembly protein TadG